MRNKFGTLLKEKTGLRVLVFIIVAALLFVYLNLALNIGNKDGSREVFREFYKTAEDSIDVMYIGTSATNRYYNTTMAFHEEGIAAYNLAVMGQPMMFTPTLVDEVQKTQDPDLYIFELRNCLSNKDLITDAHIRRVTDNMKLSSNKSKLINLAMDYTEGAEGEWSDIDENIIDYYVPILKYHSRFAAGDLGIKDLIVIDGQSVMKGYVTSPMTVTQKPQKKPVYSDERTPLAPEMEEAVSATLDKCDELKKEGKEVLFVLSPYSVKEGDMELLNTAKDMAEERGYTVLDFHDEEILSETDLDFNEDFYNSKHVNYIGAEKYTRYLTKYLKENYEIPDRRGDDNYKSWEEEYERYLDYIKDGIKYHK